MPCAVQPHFAGDWKDSGGSTCGAPQGRLCHTAGTRLGLVGSPRNGCADARSAHPQALALLSTAYRSQVLRPCSTPACASSLSHRGVGLALPMLSSLVWPAGGLACSRPPKNLSSACDMTCIFLHFSGKILHRHRPELVSEGAQLTGAPPPQASSGVECSADVLVIDDQGVGGDLRSSTSSEPRVYAGGNAGQLPGCLPARPLHSGCTASVAALVAAAAPHAGTQRARKRKLALTQDGGSASPDHEPCIMSVLWACCARASGPLPDRALSSEHCSFAV